MKKFIKKLAATLLITAVIGAGVTASKPNRVVNNNMVTIQNNQGSLDGFFTS